jgi:poly(A) polymerase
MQKIRLAAPEPLDVTNPEHFDKEKFQLNPDNAFEHTIRVLEALPLDASDELLWGALLHDIGKPKTSAPSKSHPGSFSFYGHDNVGAEMAIVLLKDRFKTSSDFVFTVSELVRRHMQMHSLHEMRMCTARRLLAEPFIEDLMKLSIADESGCILDPTAHIELAFPKWQKKVAEIRAEFAARGTPLVPGCLVTGKDLIDAGFKPGPNFKVTLNKIHDDQLNGVFESREAALEKAVQIMTSLSQH